MQHDQIETFRNIVRDLARTPVSPRADSALVCCPAHDDKKESLSISLKGDKVLLKCHTGCSQQSVIDALQKRGLWPEYKPKQEPKKEPHTLIPAPFDPPQPIVGPKGHTPSKVWNYYTKHGDLAFVVARFDYSEDRKGVLPYSCLSNPETGHPNWLWSLKLPKGEQRPLYNLLDVHAKPGAPVLVVEGEKTADAAKTMFPSMAVVTWSGGAANWRLTDWSPVMDGEREIYFWPDNDKPGIKCMTDIGQMMAKAELETKIMFDAVLKQVPEKWDLADEGDPDLDFENAIPVTAPQPKDVEEYISARTKDIADAMAKRFAIVSNSGNTFYVDLQSNSHGYDGGIPYAVIRTANDFRIYHPNKYVDPLTGKKVFEVNAYLYSENKDVLQGVKYDPTTEAVVVADHGVKKLNINCGFVASKEMGEGHLPLINHIRTAIGGDAGEWLIDWLADIAQRPGRKPGTAVILRGDQGVGKTVIGNIMCAMIGGRHAYQGSFQSSFGNSVYNGQASGKLFMQLDEMELGLSNQRNIEAAIKVATTDRQLYINEKYGFARTEESFHRYLFTSNAKMPIPVYVDDRRLAVFDVQRTAHHQDPAYWATLWNVAHSPKALANLRHFLENREIKSDVTKPPATVARLDMMAQADNLLQYVETILHEGIVPIAWGRTVTSKLGDEDWARDPVAVDKNLLLAGYDAWLKANQMGRDIRSVQVKWKTINQLFLNYSFATQKFSHDRARLAGPIVGRDDAYLGYALKLPPLAEMRERYEALVNHEVDWSAEAVVAGEEQESSVVPFNRGE